MHEDGLCECVLSLPPKRVGYGWSCVAILFERFMEIAAKSRIFAVTVCSYTQLYGKKISGGEASKILGIWGPESMRRIKEGCGKGWPFPTARAWG